MAVSSRPTATDEYAANRDETRDRGDRFSGDGLLRQHRFVIESRPDGAPALWRRTGKVYTETEARAVALSERKRGLKSLETRG